MARTQTMVQLTDELVEVLDRVAERRGLSRSALIRTLLERSLREEREAMVTRSIVDGYTRIPQLTPDDWGDVAAQGDRSTDELLQRLDAEERDAGHEPW
jgi:predicted transcriptional regulator